MSNRPTSAAQAEASRRNGAKSQGPRTEGRLRASRNALRHGLRARQSVLLAGEDGEAFQTFEAALVAELAPEGVLQSLLASRVADAAWRMHRADRMEADLLDRQSDLDPGTGGQALGLALIRDGHGPRALDTLLRYRGAVLAEFWRALAALAALRTEPGAAAVALPAAPGVAHRATGRTRAGQDHST